jgi:hypothetical protein
VVARLEGGVQVRSHGPRAGLAERGDFGVRLSRATMPPLSDDRAVADDDGSDERIG